MKKKYSDWNIMTVSKTDLDSFISAIEANYRYEYRLLPENVTNSYTPEAFASCGIELIPVFFQASITELENYILDLPEEIMVNFYDRCKPIKDKVMKLALCLADRDSTKISISMDNLENITHNGHPETKEFSTMGSFNGFSTILNDTKCFCLL